MVMFDVADVITLDGFVVIFFGDEALGVPRNIRFAVSAGTAANTADVRASWDAPLSWGPYDRNTYEFSYLAQHRRVNLANGNPITENFTGRVRTETENTGYLIADDQPNGTIIEFRVRAEVRNPSDPTFQDNSDWVTRQVVASTLERRFGRQFGQRMD